MFDFLRKPLLWEAWDKGYHKEIGKTRIFCLKAMQDLAVYSYLRDLEGMTIGEIGGGDSRILGRLAKRNRCFNIEKFEGDGGGLREEVEISDVTNIKAFLGEYDERLKDQFFDVVFSISVIEHVKDRGNFFADGMRILKPGGLWLHAIDIYVHGAPNEKREAVFEVYRSWMEGGALDPIGPIYKGPLTFSCDMASNPDDTMYKWGKNQARLISLRQQAQCVSVMVGGRKI